ncbi:hypothetical protein SCHPADRAFT_413764 [Schizopora paradoxa]|uniref:LigT-like protein n=1 Tax=Schizopora paradoxa TaxID=27342 RepID=A0A0H2RKX2_9AGAM|nr:hypothetical protein SCHPADRAFT_413764 [Schizopora paradoxa]
MRVSLWLLPPQHNALSFKWIMDHPERFGALYPLSNAYPHITLATIESNSSLEDSVQRLRNAVQKIGKSTIQIEFESIDTKHEYLRSCFLRVKRTPELTKLMCMTNKALGTRREPPDFPCQPIFYVPTQRFPEREWVVRILKQTIEPRLSEFSYDVSCMAIVVCDGDCNDWKVVEYIPLVCFLASSDP